MSVDEKELYFLCTELLDPLIGWEPVLRNRHGCGRQTLVHFGSYLEVLLETKTTVSNVRGGQKPWMAQYRSLLRCDGSIFDMT